MQEKGWRGREEWGLAARGDLTTGLQQILPWEAALPFLVSFSCSSWQEMIMWERFGNYWRKRSWSLDFKFSWKMEVFFLVIVETDATRARMSPSFHRGKMTVKAKKQKKNKRVSLGASKPLFFSVKQTRKDIIFLLCVEVLLSECRFVSCPPLPCKCSVKCVVCGRRTELLPGRQCWFPERAASPIPPGELLLFNPGNCFPHPTQKEERMETWTFPHGET